jgi:hypothetical protein
VLLSSSYATREEKHRGAYGGHGCPRHRTYAARGGRDRIYAAPGKAGDLWLLVGVVDELRGVFRSDDAARSWVRINDDQHQWGLILHVTGDPKLYGRVDVGTHGLGTLYGDPMKK